MVASGPAGQAGFPPHRDRPSQSAKEAFRSDAALRGMPRFLNTWVALADAGADNGCLYVVPAWADAEYREGTSCEARAMSALAATAGGMQAIRAVPLRAGGAVFFGGRLLHWGSQGRAAEELRPRISLSFTSTDAAVDPPCLARSHLPFPALGLRTALAAAQVTALTQKRAAMDSDQLQRCRALYTAHSAAFSGAMQRKLASRRIWAEEAAGGGDESGGNGGNKGGQWRPIFRKGSRNR